MRFVAGFATDVPGIVIVPYHDQAGHWLIGLAESGYGIPPASFASPELAAEFLGRIADFTDWTRSLEEISTDRELAARVARAWRVWQTEGM
jgi:hypothetical protein